jgi:hypothetical protein
MWAGSLDQIKEMEADGYRLIELPHGSNTPTPGLVLMANDEHDIVMLQADGSVIPLVRAFREAGQMLACLLRAHKAALAHNAEEKLAANPRAAQLATQFMRNYYGIEEE